MRKPDLLVGTQSASRALALLREVGARHPEGVRLTDLIALTGQQRATAHRLLACLVDEGFVERAVPGKAYRLGLSSLAMGLMSAGMLPVVERFRLLMQRMVRQSGDTVLLMVRSGDDVVCLHREQGAHPVKGIAVEIGSRRLMGISAAGVGILALGTDAELDASFARNAVEYSRQGVPLPRLRKAVAQTRKRGYSQATDHRAEVTRGVGCGIRFSRNSWIAMSVVAINARLPPRRCQELGLLLHDEMRALAWTGT